MALYWVGYDLITPGKDYTNLINRLQQLRAHRILLSDWLLPSTATAAQIRDDLMQHIDANDRLMVAGLKNHAGWINLMLTNADATRLFTDNAA